MSHINKGVTSLHFYVDSNGNQVDGTYGNVREVIILPGEPIAVELTEEQTAFYTKTGHIADE